MNQLCGLAIFLCFLGGLFAEDYQPFKKEPLYRDGHTDNKELKVSLFANNKLINNPISLAVDARGRVYVAEIGRFRKGVPDTRQHKVWFLEETELISLPQRLKLYEKYSRNGRFQEGHFTKHPEALVWLQDTDGDGVADKKVIFDDDYKDALMGNGSSVLLHPDGSLLYANIPDIWKVEDSNGDGKADKRTSLSYGYGLRMGVNGHDLHGLEWGVDGRLYFSNGDRGYNIRSKDGHHLYDPERGAIFRCEPDGSNLEIFSVGNRNPQDISFDQYGHLISVDNNQGRGDRSRYYYIVEGGDYAWNSGYENKRTFLDASGLKEREGPEVMWDWGAERCWDMPHEGQPAFCIPSMYFCTSGPCGITLVPGMSLGPDYQNHYLFSDYSQGIYSFAVEPNGAGLKVVNHQQFFKGGLVIDSEFGADGKLYIADYVSTSNAKEGETKGNIYLLHHPKYIAESSVRSADKILKAGFKTSSSETLALQLHHKDFRVRLFSQFELAWRGKDSLIHFQKSIQNDQPELTRLHGLWGLGILSRKYQGINAYIEPLLQDQSEHIRAWAARILGESLETSKVETLLSALKDSSAKVKGLAAVALGKTKDHSVAPALVQILKENNNQDPFLRHYAVHALSLLNHRDLLAAEMKHPSAAVRLGILLAMTKLGDTRIEDFLNDEDPFIVEETIRAITRTDMVRALPALADHAKKYHKGYVVELPHYQFERIIQANMRLGLSQHAENLKGLAMNPNLPYDARHLALCELKRWNDPQPLDPAVGQVRSYNFSRANLVPLMANLLPDLLKSSEGLLLDTAVSLAIAYNLKVDSNILAQQAKSSTTPLDSRIAKLDALYASSYPEIAQLTLELSKNAPYELRKKAIALLAKVKQDQAMNLIQTWIQKNDNMKLSYAALQDIQLPAADRILVQQLTKLTQGKHPKDSQLNLIMACEAKGAEAVQQALKNYHNSLDKNDLLAIHRPMLYGGDVNRGKEIANNHGRAQCLVCHKIGKKGGVIAPNLANIGKRHNQEHLLEALIKPSAYVTPGFGNMTLTLKNGSTEIGSPLREDKQTLTLLMADKSEKVINKSEIANRGEAISLMPSMLNILQKDEIRDVLAYLKTLKKPIHKSNAH